LSTFGAPPAWFTLARPNKEDPVNTVTRSVRRFLVSKQRQLRQELPAWHAHARWPFRFVVAGITAWLSYEFGRVFTLLPEGWRDAVAANALTAPGAFVLAALLVFATASFGMGLLSAKAINTL
jgi:hypothetical protein